MATSQAVLDAQSMIDGSFDKEAITYEPYKGIPRQVTVLIDRKIIQSSDVQTPQKVKTARTTYIVSILNDETLGVSSPQVGYDVVCFKDNLSDMDVTRFSVSAIASQDPGMYQLEVVK